MNASNEPTIRYEDWLDVSLKFIDQESKRDGKPIVLYGLSAGGMPCYHAACQESRVADVAGMCFIDTEILAVLKEISIFPSFVEDLNRTLLPVLSRSPLKNIKVPMKSISKMTGLVNIPEALSILMDDRGSVEPVFGAQRASGTALLPRSRRFSWKTPLITRWRRPVFTRCGTRFMHSSSLYKSRLNNNVIPRTYPQDLRIAARVEAHP